jgi:nucleoside-diphosphate-sugar epimerase
LSGKRALITGATGFVGANLARRLLRDGHEVHVLVRPDATMWRIASVRDDLRIHVADLGDRMELARLLALVRADWIFHLAAYGAYPTQRDWPRMVDTNIVGTFNLVDSAVSVGFEAFVNTGSSSEYGSKDHAPAETEGLDPNSHYAVTKASATMLCRYTARTCRVSIPTLRLYSVYGPYEEPTRLMPTLLLRALQGSLPPLVDPETVRDFVYIDDVCDAYVLAAQRSLGDPGAIYNIGSGRQTTLRDLVESVRTTFGISDQPSWGSMSRRSWDTPVWVADNDKARRELNWSPTTELDRGLDLTMAWLRTTGALHDEYRHS